jgi:hypothetical protein
MTSTADGHSCLACGKDAFASIRDAPPYSHAIAFYAPSGRFHPVVALLCPACHGRFPSDPERNRFLEGAFLQNLRSSLQTASLDLAC